MDISGIRDVLYEFRGKGSMYETDIFENDVTFSCKCGALDHTPCFIRRYKNINYGGLQLVA
jgi:hypothetical protein